MDTRKRVAVRRFMKGMPHPHDILENGVSSDVKLTAQQRFMTLMRLAKWCWIFFPPFETNEDKRPTVIPYEEKYQINITNLCNFLMDHCTWQEIVTFLRLLPNHTFTFSSFRGNETFTKLAKKYRDILRCTI